MSNVTIHSPLVREVLRAGLLFVTSIVAGMQVYASPPESIAVFWQWVWQPSMQGMSIALASLMAALGFSALDQRRGSK